uniref:Major facilitator superfamily (MFS) profile domain-containing protein n=1 Tax=Mycena chlorophos TaxID=658473 RepID=A0ABQ0LCR9_MYCCL|nr:predicted protein [Mycena chlorophos]
MSSVQPPTSNNGAHLRRERLQLAVLCWTLFTGGWNDGSNGPLIPRMQQVYHVDYTIVSLIFIFQCFGSTVGAVGNIALIKRFGFGKLVIFGSCLQLVAYAIQACDLPFPVFLLGSVINGIGGAVKTAQANGYAVGLSTNAELKIGLLQASYGVGALIAPLAATQFAQLSGRKWAFYYLTSLGVILIDTINLTLVFRGRTQEDCLADIGQEFREKEKEGNKGHLRQILSTKAAHMLALFLFVYVGTEVSIGGWIVSFLISRRSGSAATGYVSSGFFGGLTLGRVILIPINKRLGERRVVFIYGVIAIGLELVIWLVHSLIGDAIAVSFVGLVMGPLFPIAITHTTKVFPPWLVTGAVGWATGAATVGAAIMPFVTGVISNRAGITALEPVVIAMLAIMVLSWMLVPGTQIEATEVVVEEAQSKTDSDEKSSVGEQSLPVLSIADVE